MPSQGTLKLDEPGVLCTVSAGFLRTVRDFVPVLKKTQGLMGEAGCNHSVLAKDQVGYIRQVVLS